MAVRRDLRPLLLIAVLAIAVALANTVTGLDTGILLLSPAMVLLVPLLLGRYLGEDRLQRLAARFAPRRARPVSAPLPRLRPRSLTVRGGRLLAAALAERGPPATVVA
jgi:hypothetical protein